MISTIVSVGHALLENAKDIDFIPIGLQRASRYALLLSFLGGQMRIQNGCKMLRVDPLLRHFSINILHKSPPRVDSSKGPNRVNRAHGPTKENKKNICICFFDFPGPCKKISEMA